MRAAEHEPLGCHELTSLPESLGQLGMLQSMNIMQCSGLTSLPMSLMPLRSLQNLNSRGCSGLTQLLDMLPERWGELHTLGLRGWNGQASPPVSTRQLGASQNLNFAPHAMDSCRCPIPSGSSASCQLWALVGQLGAMQHGHWDCSVC
jgi:hypothetical protein